MTTEWSSDKVRSTFIEFFEKKKNHVFVPSSPVLPHDDPTLLFANAGMNQFKPIFLGTVDPKSVQATWKRACNSQKCIRAGGKHNDLDDVGKDVYHHTFFEMLGNWSFGDYFKREAIEWAWELLTEVFKLDKERIYVTYFQGNPALNVPEDTEARDIWLEKLPASRVLPFGMKENFWEMGETGPCGPCSEIHYDKIGGRDAASLVNMDDPTVIEIWNNVFIQFNREANGSLVPLPAKHVDTGLGLERLTAILQNVPSNYDIDLFSSLFKSIKEVVNSDVPEYSGKVGAEDKGNIDMAYRVVADHIRTLTIAITDGALPSNEGRGYVLRRILRRAVRYGRSVLGAKTSFFYKLTKVVVSLMSSAFPELSKDPDFVESVIKEEEEQFALTLEKGEKRFNKIAATLAPGAQLPADVTVDLYSTYGFPFDLTQILASEKQLQVCSEAEFNQILKSGATSASGNKENKIKLDVHAIAAAKKLAPLTNDDFKYINGELQAKLHAIWDGQQYIEEAADKLVGLLFDKTNFYAESGGQIYDTGFIDTHPVQDVQVYGGYVLHVTEIKGKTLKVGDTLTLKVDYERRAPIKSNHTATHMVNFALRKVLGDKVDQKGSLVTADRFRFDFSHNKPVSTDEIAKVDDLVRDIIKKELKVYYKDVPLESARKIHGLRAVFGEQYPDPVRVVSVGVSVDDLLANPANPEWANYSIEFCGGTHIVVSSEVVAFATLREDPLARGIRRIISVTGQEALRAINLGAQLEAELNSLEKLTGEQLDAGIQEFNKKLNTPDLHVPVVKRSQLQDHFNKIRAKRNDELKAGKGGQQKEASAFAEKVLKELEENPSSFYVADFLPGVGSNLLTDVIKSIQEKKEVSVLLTSLDKKKILIVASSPKNLVPKLKANEWAAAAAKAAGGKGGGKPETAQGAGNDVTKLAEVLEAAKSFAAASFA